MPKEIVWTTQDHHRQEKPTDWFWSLGIIVFSIIIAAILFKNFLLAMLVLTASVTLGLLAKKEPQTAQMALTQVGFIYGDTLYPYDIMTRFWIQESTKTTSVLLIETTKIMAPHISVHLPISRTAAVRKTLRENKVKEEEIYEPISHKLMDLIGV